MELVLPCSTVVLVDALVLPTDGANCRDTIFNDPRMTWGSYIKGPNNMICREWVWKGWTLVVGQRFS